MWFINVKSAVSSKSFFFPLHGRGGVRDGYPTIPHSAPQNVVSNQESGVRRQETEFYQKIIAAVIEYTIKQVFMRKLFTRNLILHSARRNVTEHDISPINNNYSTRHDIRLYAWVSPDHIIFPQ